MAKEDSAAYINGTAFFVSGNGEFAVYSEPAERKAIRKETGSWTVDELIEKVPKTLLKGYKSPVVSMGVG